MSILIAVVALIWGGALFCSIVAGCLCAVSPRIRQGFWGEHKPLPIEHPLIVQVLDS